MDTDLGVATATCSLICDSSCHLIKNLHLPLYAQSTLEQMINLDVQIIIFIGPMHYVSNKFLIVRISIRTQ